MPSAALRQIIGCGGGGAPMTNLSAGAQL